MTWIPVELIWEGGDMHIMSAVNLHINEKHVGPSCSRIPVVMGRLESTIGPSPSWKGCPFVAILNYPGQPMRSVPFLLTFSSALLGGSSVTDPSH